MSRTRDLKEGTRFWGYSPDNPRKPRKTCAVSDEEMHALILKALHNQRGDIISFNQLKRWCRRAGIQARPATLRDLIQELGLLRLDDSISNKETYRIPESVMREVIR